MLLCLRITHEGDRLMKRITYAISLSLICALLLTGCGGQTRPIQTPEETIDTAFSALKELDMDTFNACTNNKAGTGYQLFSDLFRKKERESMLLLAQELVQNLSWEINSVQIEQDIALANVTIHNKDFSNAIGIFVADLIQNINNKQKNNSNLASLVHTTINEARNSPENLLPYLQDCNNDFSATVSITLKKVDNNWQIQLDDSLCNTLTGNLGSDTEKYEEKISAAEELLTRNLERWGVDMEKNADQWAEQLEQMLKQIFQ